MNWPTCRCQWIEATADTVVVSVDFEMRAFTVEGADVEAELGEPGYEGDLEAPDERRSGREVRRDRLLGGEPEGSPRPQAERSAFVGAAIGDAEGHAPDIGTGGGGGGVLPGERQVERWRGRSAGRLRCGSDSRRPQRGRGGDREENREEGGSG